MNQFDIFEFFKQHPDERFSIGELLKFPEFKDAKTSLLNHKLRKLCAGRLLNRDQIRQGKYFMYKYFLLK